MENSDLLTPPRATFRFAQHVLDTYASETNKTASVFRAFSDEHLAWRPHDKSMTVLEIMRHNLLSERRFFAEFLSSPELEIRQGTTAAAEELLRLARPRLAFLADKDETWWLEWVRFFDVERERIWVFWRRVLHSARHRTQLTVYLRLLDQPVVSVYGPTADVTWAGADPTLR